MENNKQNATLFVYQWVDENEVPDDTGKLSDMLIAYGNKLNIPDVMQQSELFFKFIDEHYSHSSENYRNELKKSFTEWNLKNSA